MPIRRHPAPELTVPGVPAWTADGRLAWTADREDTRRLIIGAPGALAQAEPVTPPGLQVRAVIDVDGGFRG